MKKLLSLALILALVATLTTSVFADTVPVVGNHAAGTGVTPAEFTTGIGMASEIKITVEAGQVQSRYAVDVEYDAFAITVLGGNLVWDVKTLEYKNEGSVDDLNITDRVINIYNYSDQPVSVTPVITDNEGADDFITITASVNAPFVVEKAQVGSEAVDVRRGKGSFTVSVTSTDWNKVATHYADELSTGTRSVVVGTISLTISKAPTP